jgi:hypothetical protein
MLQIEVCIIKGGIMSYHYVLLKVIIMTKKIKLCHDPNNNNSSYGVSADRHIYCPTVFVSKAMAISSQLCSEERH